jgi:hypothetical protein
MQKAMLSLWVPELYEARVHNDNFRHLAAPGTMALVNVSVDTATPSRRR